MPAAVPPPTDERFTSKFTWDFGSDDLDPHHADDAPAVLRHLPGQHNQQLHGGGGGEPGTGQLMTEGFPAEKFGRDPARFVAEATEADLEEMFSPPGYRAVTKQLRGRGGSIIRYTAAIQNEDGKKVGDIEREFSTGGTVYHSSFILYRQAQGKGLGTLMNGWAEDYYRSAGFEKITLYADITVGKYVWAQQGFDYAEGTAKGHLDAAKSYFQERSNRDWDAFLQESGVDPDKAHAWQVAALDDGNKYSLDRIVEFGRKDIGPVHLGKAAMISSGSWDGVKDIRDGSESRKIGDAYFHQIGSRT